MSECLSEADIRTYLNSTGTPESLRSHVQGCVACQALIRRLDAGVRTAMLEQLAHASYTLPVLHARTGTVLGEARLWLIRRRTAKDECGLELDWRGSSYSANGADYLSALKALRRTLLVEGWDVLCNGSLVNCFASGILADSGSGLRTYLLEMGQPASRDQIVRTFDQTDEPYVVGAPDEQAAFLDGYLVSLADSPA